MRTIQIDNSWKNSRFVARNILIICVLSAIVTGSTLAYFVLPGWMQWISSEPAAAHTVATNGSDQWVGDEQITTVTSSFSLPEKVSVSPLFAPYYQKPGITTSLGAPITVAFPTSQGWMQFFVTGALLLPTTPRSQAQNTDDPLASLVKSGVKDPVTGVIRLPLLQSLLTAGSQAPIGGKDSTTTYVDLRKATNPNLMLPIPTTNPRPTLPTPAASPTPTIDSRALQGVFVKGGRRGDKDVGHLIPQSFWSYINRPDISPHGWDQDFGAPLTEALAFTLTQNGSNHRMIVQAFARDGLLLDQDALGESSIRHLDTGKDYLSTIGPPKTLITAQQTMWAQNTTALLQSPGAGQTLAHVGKNFPLRSLGKANWTRGMPWYYVQWSAPKNSHSGWVSAAAVTFNPPGNAPAWASLDTLSRDLASYLVLASSNVGTVIYDVSHQRYYTYNSDKQFIMASSVKVPIMLALFDMIENQKRTLSSGEMALLTTMIENSNNDSATALYNEIGGSAGLTNFLKKVKVSGLTPDEGAWGYSLSTPQAMVDLLTLLHNGKILTARDRAIAIDLMKHIQPDQQVGVGDTAPHGASIAM
ncbi:MAG: serine hydrolase, partial [Ktedonobacteraceae bacterium]|nr:serine hydrolase [Ktedonobacteraceae bacterium]